MVGCSAAHLVAAMAVRSAGRTAVHWVPQMAALWAVRWVDWWDYSSVGRMVLRSAGNSVVTKAHRWAGSSVELLESSLGLH